MPRLRNGVLAAEPAPETLLARLRPAVRSRRAAQVHARRVQRPSYEQLVREIQATSYVAVGRKYGVSDNAVRKWVRQYEREAGAVRLPRAA